jgi:hypothetical protein
MLQNGYRYQIAQLESESMNKESLIEQLQKIADNSLDVCDYIIITRDVEGLFDHSYKIGGDKESIGNAERKLAMLGCIDSIKYSILKQNYEGKLDD